MQDSKTLFYSSEFPSACDRRYSEFTDSLGTCPRGGSPALGCAISDESFLAHGINCVVAFAPGKPHVKQDQVAGHYESVFVTLLWRVTRSFSTFSASGCFHSYVKAGCPMHDWNDSSATLG